MIGRERSLLFLSFLFSPFSLFCFFSFTRIRVEGRLRRLLLAFAITRYPDSLILTTNTATNDYLPERQTASALSKQRQHCNFIAIAINTLTLALTLPSHRPDSLHPSRSTIATLLQGLGEKPKWSTEEDFHMYQRNSKVPW